ncbi:MAG: acyl carrier protein [Oscillospiraceae bacterium]|nr:acyl carrier protein [Clostridiaceae bacterium]MDO4496170.1 acyl carrier protein [Clostridiaceae bacterium]MDY5948969.1 acyl carrier protein [Oscillospiraceae bacterium]
MILEKLISLICEELGFDEDEVNENTAVGDLVSDDLEIEELALALESEFEIELGSELSGDISVSELADIIEDSINS